MCVCAGRGSVSCKACISSILVHDLAEAQNPSWKRGGCSLARGRPVLADITVVVCYVFCKTCKL